MAVDEELANGLLKFRPMETQERFLRSRARIRLLLGGNASGKTLAAMADASWEAMQGTRCGIVPNHGWVVRPSFSRQPQTDAVWSRIVFGDEHFDPFVPRGLQVKMTGNPKNVLPLTNGSTISVRSWGQGALRLQGESPHYVICDEEAPDEYVHELVARLFRKSSGWFAAAVTDTTASAWLVDFIERADRGDKNIEVFRMDTRDNIHIDQSQVKAFAEGMDDIEQAIRVTGGLKMASGRVYKCWSDANWKQPEELPLDGTDYVFIDPGIANPCAALWVRVTRPERKMMAPGVYGEVSDMWLFGEYYKRGESDIKKHVQAIWQKCAELVSRPVKYYIDPWAGNQRIASINSTRTVMDVWTQAGIPVVTASSRPEMYRLERFREMEKWVKITDTTRGNMYAIRGLDHFNREIFKYVVSGLVDPNTRANSMKREVFRGPNHLLWGSESACVMRPAYIPRATAQAIRLTGLDHAATLAWSRISTGERLFSSGELGAQVERMKPA